MKIEDLLPDMTEAFGADDYGRGKAGEALTRLVLRYQQPQVIALDGAWGTGKSWFLERWVTALNGSEKTPVTAVYFDAFANDFLDDPLVGLVSALIEAAPQKDRSIVERVKGAAPALTRIGLRGVINAATLGGAAYLEEAVEEGVKAAGKTVDKEVDGAVAAFWKKEEGRRKAMEEFRAALSALAEAAGGKGTEGRLIFVVDELDRCRPDYALQVLEVIKHAFAVKGAHFVLGVHLGALESMVRARYGEGVDAGAYLRKFVNLTVELPRNNGGLYPEVLSLSYLRQELKSTNIGALFQGLVDHVAIVARTTHVSFRDVERIVAAANMLPGSLSQEDLPNGVRVIILTLLVARVLRPELAMKLIAGSAEEAAVLRYLGVDPDTHASPSGEGRSSDDVYKAEFAAAVWAYVLSGGRAESVKNVELRLYISHHFGALLGAGRQLENEKPAYIARRYLDALTVAP